MRPSRKILQFKRQTQESKNNIKKIEVKPIILDEVSAKDDSTINYVKRLGGQMFQMYSLKDTVTEIKDNVFIYNLLSGIYPIELSAEITKHSVPSISINITQVRKEVLTNTDISSTKLANFISMDFFQSIAYPKYSLPVDSMSSKLPELSLNLIDTIRYTYRPVSMDTMTTLPAKMKSITTEYFPIVNYSVEETTTAAVNKIVIGLIYNDK